MAELYIIKRLVIELEDETIYLYFHSLTERGVPLWVSSKDDAQYLQEDEADRLSSYLGNNFIDYEKLTVEQV